MKTLIEFDTVIGTSNLGDDIIYQSLKEELDFLYEQCFVMRFGTHIKNLPLSRYYFGSQKLDFAYHADFKIIMGTNMLSRDIRKTQPQWPIGRMDSWLYKDSILAGVGTTLNKGEITPYSRKIYDRILRKDFYHSVRDEESKEMLESMGFKALNTGCPTLWKLTPEWCEQIPKNKADHVIFSLSGYNNQKKRKQDEKLIEILKRNYKKLIFWCQTSVDEPYLDSFQGTGGIERIYSLKQYADYLDAGNVDYVGTRLHGGIFALQHRVRSIVIAIDHRARGFHETNGIVICERDEIDTKLEPMIQQPFETKIRLQEKEIKAFKDQFRVTYPKRKIETHDKYPLVKVTKLAKKVARKLKNAVRARKNHVKTSLPKAETNHDQDRS